MHIHVVVSKEKKLGRGHCDWNKRNNKNLQGKWGMQQNVVEERIPESKCTEEEGRQEYGNVCVWRESTKIYCVLNPT